MARVQQAAAALLALGAVALLVRQAATPAPSVELFAHGGAKDFVGHEAVAFAHGGAKDFVGRAPQKSSFRPFRAHAFAKQGAQRKDAARFESLREVKDPKLHQEAAHYRELMKCMHLAKAFKGTHPGSRKVTQADRKEAMTCLSLVKGKGRAAASRAPAKAARSAVQHSAAYLFREVPETHAKTATQRLRLAHGGTAAPAHKAGAAALPRSVQKLPAWDDKAQDALAQHALSAGQVAKGVSEWEGIGQAHVRPPSRGRSTRESTGTTTHFFK